MLNLKGIPFYFFFLALQKKISRSNLKGNPLYYFSLQKIFPGEILYKITPRKTMSKKKIMGMLCNPDQI